MKNKLLNKVILSFTIACFFAAQGACHGLDIFCDGRKPVDAGLRSAVLPGWGQLYNGYTVKGYTFMVLEGIGAVTSYVYYRKADKKYDKYDKLGMRNSSLYDDYENYMDTSRTAAMLCGVFWAYGIMEAYFTAGSRTNFSFETDFKSIRLVYKKKFGVNKGA